jgi:hypothetical protein
VPAQVSRPTPPKISAGNRPNRNTHFLPPSLIASPIEFYSCFISFSHNDEAFANQLFSQLRESKLRVWYAPHNAEGGKKLYDQIDEAIQLHDKLILVLSDHSIVSEWVMTEIRRARQRELKEKRKILFPIRLTDFETLKKMDLFRHRHWKRPRGRGPSIFRA